MPPKFSGLDLNAIRMGVGSYGSYHIDEGRNWRDADEKIKEAKNESFTRTPVTSWFGSSMGMLRWIVLWGKKFIKRAINTTGRSLNCGDSGKFMPTRQDGSPFLKVSEKW